MVWNIRIFSKRNTEPKPRTNPELSEPARKKIAYATNQYIDFGVIQDTYEEYLAQKGEQISYFNIQNRGPALKSNRRFIVEEDHIEVIDYLEILLNKTWTAPRLNQRELLSLNSRIDEILVEEGVLWELKPDPEEIEGKIDAFSNSSLGALPYDPRKHAQIRFQQLADETVIEAEESVRILLQGEEWREPLKAYNKAWELYRNGTHTYVILEKLYISLEAVTEKICTEFNDWEKEGQGVGRYLEILKEKGLFEQNPAMNQEVNHLAQSMEVFINRLGGDRKRHKNISKDYCILVLHQTSAYLTYIIKRYKMSIDEGY